MAQTKYSSLSDAARVGITSYIDDRWIQISSLEKDAVYDGVKYLFLVNAGGAVAMLSFLGASPDLRNLLWPKAILALFMLGIIVVGVFRFCQHHFAARLYDLWQDGVTRFYADDLTWEEVLAQDQRTKDPITLLVLAYFAFGCFLVAVVVGAVNLFCQ